MTCHDARDCLSDLLDDALEPEPRARVDAHLAGCAECRRELERLRATISLLRAVERPHAPAGFVDRVLERARPTPWHQRLLDWLAVVRLLRFPVEAAAVVLVASLAVYVFQGTPALKQAARPEISQDHVADSSRSTVGPTAAPPIEATAGPDTRSGQTEESAEIRSKSQRSSRPVPPTAPPTLAAPDPSLEQHLKEPASVEEQAAAAARGSARSPGHPAPREPASSAPATASVPEGAARAPGLTFGEEDSSAPVEGKLRPYLKDNATGEGGAAQRATSQSPPVPPGPVPPPERRDRIARDQDPQRSERPAAALTPATRPTAPSAVRIVASTRVEGRLTVKDRQAANRALTELLSRVGGTEIARRAEPGGDTVSLVVPRAAYPAFTQGLARIGAWLPETASTELPDRIPITLRITQSLYDRSP